MPEIAKKIRMGTVITITVKMKNYQHKYINFHAYNGNANEHIPQF